ncbi:unnamed protein product [Caenorhabditis auriculariae]|uniref:F-box domain-containing protein n=1 Tax=Caenorhabditis auriculariae TaxID=2777116 RepID=A0A8S1HP80_9PELO|nr:unnamed protein product [Caenorhabditis auriculariae]
MEVQRKRSFNTTNTAHDFRQEYKGSVLESKFRSAKKPERNAFRSLADWILAKASYLRSAKPKPFPTSMNVFNSTPSDFEKLPNELVCQIFGECDATTLLSCRRVCRRFSDVVDYIDPAAPVVLSRLVLTGQPKKGLEMRWVTYEGQRTKAVTVTASEIRNGASFGFNFERFVVQRIIIKDIVLTDDFVDFLRHQLQYSDLSQLVQLSLNNVDFSAANSLTLHRLLAGLAKHLELFEVTGGFGMRADSVTDAHLGQLDATRVRRISIDGVRFGSRCKALRVGDASLRLFAASRSFPTLILDRCAVTTRSVCDYTQEWFEQRAETEKQLRSQVCTVKRCPGVKGSAFAAECQRRGLQCRDRRASGTLTLYNIHEGDADFKREFTVALAAVASQDDESPAKPQPVEAAPVLAA